MATILVVDDETVTLRLLQLTLNRYGYEVLTAKNGEQALAVLAQTKVDLILTDLNMPIMSGQALLRIMGNNPSLSRLPVVILTAVSSEQARLKKESGENIVFLIKPISSRDLLGTIKSCLAGPSGEVAGQPDGRFQVAGW